MLVVFVALVRKIQSIFLYLVGILSAVGYILAK